MSFESAFVSVSPTPAIYRPLHAYYVHSWCVIHSLLFHPRNTVNPWRELSRESAPHPQGVVRTSQTYKIPRYPFHVLINELLKSPPHCTYCDQCTDQYQTTKFIVVCRRSRRRRGLCAVRSLSVCAARRRRLSGTSPPLVRKLWGYRPNNKSYNGLELDFLRCILQGASP